MTRQKLPKGFLANGLHCGLKKKRKDLSLFYSESPAKAAAVFTRNVVKAAPVIVAQEIIKKGTDMRAVIVNSGNANCMTGARGIKDAKKMAASAAKLLRVSKSEVLVASTGVIGKVMDMKPVINGMGKLVKGLSHDGLIEAADGIMTTDRFHKVSTRVFTIGEEKVTMTGVAKGAGMIDPSMATMLCFILTDADISRKALKKALSAGVDTSFNSITVDGDMSTNDTVMLLANGEAGNRHIEESGKDFEIFLENLNTVSRELAAMIVKDGEGASKFIEVKVKGAKTGAEAKKAAEAVANSLLVKCAVLGGDPNWGRIASSVGASGIDFDPGKIEVILDGVTFFKSGKVASEGKRKAASVFKNKNVHIEVNLHHGKAEADFYTCDISKRYITLNSYYTT